MDCLRIFSEREVHIGQVAQSLNVVDMILPQNLQPQPGTLLELHLGLLVFSHQIVKQSDVVQVVQRDATLLVESTQDYFLHTSIDLHGLFIVPHRVERVR